MAQAIGVDTVVIEETAVDGASKSAVSWAAVFAGAASAAAIGLLLLMLGAAIGLGSVSPWPGTGASVTTFTVGAAIWLIIVHWASSFLGGYMAGRLRTRWTGLHTDEVFFRDTAHGFLAWAIATLFTFGVLAAVASATVAGAGIAATSVTSSAVEGATAGGAAAIGGDDAATTYLTDALFRPAPAAGTAAAEPAAAATTEIEGATGVSTTETTTPTPAPAPAVATTRAVAGGAAAGAGRDVRGESGLILARGVAAEQFPEADRDYLVQLVASETGLSQADAEARVNDVIARAEAMETEAREAADAAREAGSKAMLFSFFALLIGAFIASVSGAWAGRLRDA